MAFELLESHTADYMAHGFTVFRGIIPPSLIRDLRRAAVEARTIARAQKGPQAQRLQPVSDYELDPRPFRDYAELPQLREALHRVIGPTAWHGDPKRLAVLLEPAQGPWCTPWHRDITARTPGFDPAEFETLRYRRDFFNQVNCALYDDASTWYVPGSHCRDDVASEAAHVGKCPTPNWDGVAEGGSGQEETEARCLQYCRGMPRAVCLHLSAGDFGLYRPLGWHMGNYAPYRIRATLHDTVWTPEVAAWYQRWNEATGQKP